MKEMSSVTALRQEGKCEEMQFQSNGAEHEIPMFAGIEHRGSDSAQKNVIKKNQIRKFGSVNHFQKIARKRETLPDVHISTPADLLTSRRQHLCGWFCI